MRPRGLGRFPTAAALLVGLTFGVGSTALATTFSYQVDRFELDGAPRGPFDGVADYVDDFANGAIGPDWYRAYGTVSEHDGFLFLTDPGTVLPDPYRGSLELSIAASGSPYPQDGGGNFTGTAYWLPLLPPAGHHYHFSIYTWSGTPYFNEIVGLGFLGLGDGNYAIEQHATEIDLTHGIYQNLVSVQHPVDAAEITGNLGMRLAFDDATNLVTASFSLDGGATWQSPFQATPIFNGRTMAQFILSADPVADGTTPSSTSTTSTSTVTTTSSTSTTILDPCVATGCRRSIVPRASRLAMRISSTLSQTVVWKWKKGQATTLSDFGNPLSSTSYDLCVADGVGILFRQIVMPGTSWRSRTTSYRYSITQHSTGTRRLVLQSGADLAANLSLTFDGWPNATTLPPLTLPITVRLRSSDGTCWANVFGAPATSSTPRAFRASGD